MKAKVYKRQDRQDRWYVQLSWKGQKYVRYYYDNETPFVHEALAQIIADQINGDIHSKGKSFQPEQWFGNAAEKFCFDTYASNWLERQKHLAPSYLPEVKRFILKYAIPFFEKTDIREIRLAHIEDFADSLPVHLSNKSKKNVLTTLHKLFSDAFRREEIVRIPGFPQINVPEPEFRWISASWQKKIIAKIEEIDRPIFLFIRFTGVRPGEARAFQWDCVDFENRQINIRRTFSRSQLRETTKTRQAKPIPMTRILEELLLAQKEKTKVVDMHGNPHGLVFLNRWGRPYSVHISQIWNEARDKVGAPKVNLYQGTRHSRGTQLLEQGWDLDMVRTLMGHTRKEMTERYAKFAATSRLAKAMEQADEGW
jgi:integrase